MSIDLQPAATPAGGRRRQVPALVLSIAGLLLAAVGFVATITTVVTQVDALWIGLSVLALLIGEIMLVAGAIVAIVSLVRGASRVGGAVAIAVSLFGLIGSAVGFVVVAIVASVVVISSAVVFATWMSALFVGSLGT